MIAEALPESVPSPDLRVRLVLLRDDVNALYPYRSYEEVAREIELIEREIDGIDRILISRGEKPGRRGISRPNRWAPHPKADGPRNARPRRNFG